MFPSEKWVQLSHCLLVLGVGKGLAGLSWLICGEPGTQGSAQLYSWGQMLKAWPPLELQVEGAASLRSQSRKSFPVSLGGLEVCPWPTADSSVSRP